jgi:ankyrin repeat protein
MEHLHFDEGEMRFKFNLQIKAMFALAFFVFTVVAVLLVFNELKKSLGEYQTLKASLIALEKEHKRLLSDRDIRLWKTPTCDFFKNRDLNELCLAISAADERKFEVLLEKNLDLNEVGRDGMTVLFFAYMEGEYPGFIRLLSKGAKPDVPLTKKQEVPKGIPVNEGETVMFAACRNPWERRRYMQPALTNADNASLQDSRGHTVLHQMLGLSPPIIKSVLLEVKDCGIDPTIRDKAGKTARDYAVEMAPELLPIFDSMMKKSTTIRDETVSSPLETKRVSIGDK